MEGHEPDCMDCKHEMRGSYNSPCLYCSRVRRGDKWEPMEPIVETWYMFYSEENRRIWHHPIVGRQQITTYEMIKVYKNE